MSTAYWEMRARRSPYPADPGMVEFLRMEYPQESAAWLSVDPSDGREAPRPPTRASGSIGDWVRRLLGASVARD